MAVQNSRDFGKTRRKRRAYGEFCGEKQWESVKIFFIMRRYREKEMRVSMRKDYLVGVTVVSQQEQKIRLEYYLIEERRDVGDIALYGMLIKRESRVEGRIEKMQGAGKAISYSREYVERMIQLFMKNAVTPLTMEELIDEYISREGLPV